MLDFRFLPFIKFGNSAKQYVIGCQIMCSNSKWNRR